MPDLIDCELMAKAQQVLGLPLYCGSLDVFVPELALRRCEYIAVNVGHDGLRTPDEVERGVEWRRSENAIHLEFHKRKLRRGRAGAKTLLLLVTPQYVERRLHSILERYRLDRRDSPVATEALENILFGLYSGNVNGLVTQF